MMYFTFTEPDEACEFLYALQDCVINDGYVTLERAKKLSGWNHILETDKLLQWTSVKDGKSIMRKGKPVVVLPEPSLGATLERIEEKL